MATGGGDDDRERLVPPPASTSYSDFPSSSPWDDTFAESVGNILRRTRTTSRSEVQQREAEQEQKRQQRRRRAAQAQQRQREQDQHDAILPADPVSRAHSEHSRLQAENASQQVALPDDEELQLTGCAGSCFCHPKSLCHRGIALFLMSAIGFGSYFCFDNPGALQDVMREELRITAYQFSLFYAWYSMPNTVLPIIGGYLIDGFFGMRLATIIYAFIIVIGQVMFAVGAYFDLLAVMEVARFIFGVGGESLAVAQNTYAVAWFKDNLNMVFGLQLSVARAGSSVNFWTVGKLFHYIEDSVGTTGLHALGITLGICCLTCIASFICAIVSTLDIKSRYMNVILPFDFCYSDTCVDRQEEGKSDKVQDELGGRC